MQGYIDAFSNGYISGWVKLTNQDHPISINVLIDDHPIANRYHANLFRADVQDAGIGHGRYGFHIPVPKEFIKAGANNVSILSPDWDHKPLKREMFLTKEQVSFWKGQPVNHQETYLGPDKGIILHVEEISEFHIKGWCVNNNDKRSLVDIDIMIDGMKYARIKNSISRQDLKAKKISDGHGGFDVFLPQLGMERGSHLIEIMVNGEVKYNNTISIDKDFHKINSNIVAFPINNLSVIVPIYNALEDVEECIKNLINFTPKSVNIVLIDDASTDKRILPLLKKAALIDNIRYIRNESNLGFTRTVNLGFDETGNDDVIILNSDARVTPRWVEGMVLAAQSAPRIATVTAMSDRAGAFSAPLVDGSNALPKGVSEATYARNFRRLSLGLYPVVPTGNGFCMFIRRECLQEIGGLDAQAFPRGYGEENDFCMRALRAGWQNIIDDRTYVFHERSKSFGDERNNLRDNGKAVLDERYPEYKKLIEVFTNDLSINAARYRAHMALVACCEEPHLPLRIVFVVSTQSGGTPQTNKDLMSALSSDVDCWVLRCDSVKIELSHMVDGNLEVAKTYQLGKPIDPVMHDSREYNAVVSQWLLGLDADIIHIRHIAWHSLSLISISRNLGMKIVYSFHDYYSICPTVNLMDSSDTFCGGTCTKSEGECKVDIWNKNLIPELKNKWVHVWRDKFSGILKHCDAFVTTSESTRNRMLSHMPNLPYDRFMVIPHGRDFTSFHRLSQPSTHGEPLRILVPGNISVVKGLDVIYRILEEDRGSLLEFHVLGKVVSSPWHSHPRLIRHGTYNRAEFAEKVAEIRPHIGAVLSVCDETYCHTLTELWSVGLPVVAFNFATVASRILDSGAGWVVKHENIPDLYQEIVSIAFDQGEMDRAHAAVDRWQQGEGRWNSTRVMAASYFDIYRNILKNNLEFKDIHKTKRIAVVCPAQADLRSANASTHIRVWERTQNRVERNLNYIKMTPLSLIASLRKGNISGAIIQRTAIPQTLQKDLMSAFQKSGIPYIFDIDDDLLDVPAEKDRSGAYCAYAETLQRIMACATLMTVSTERLKERYSSFNKDIVVVPNLLSDRLWQGMSTAQRSALPGSGTAHAVYMGTHTHDRDLEMILPALDAVADLRPDFKLTLIGVLSGSLDGFARPWLDRLEVPEGIQDYPRFVQWMKGISHNFDFAIAPLEDTEFNRLKSPLKVLEYSALGLPVIASDIEVYRNVAHNAPAAVLTNNTSEEWRSALLRQIDLGAENARLGQKMRDWVWHSHMLDKSLPEFDRLVSSTIRNSRAGKTTQELILS